MRPCIRVAREALQSHIDKMALAAKGTTAPFLRCVDYSQCDFTVGYLIVSLSDQSLPPPFSQRMPHGVTTEHVYTPELLPVYPARNLTRNQFLRLWSAGIPVVITEAQKNFRGHWDPDYFIEHHGKLWVTPIDCETDQERPRMAARDFFALLLKKSSEQQTVLKLKVGSFVMFCTVLDRVSGSRTGPRRRTSRPPSALSILASS